uniref:Uncharacterized protein n=1 Tax=Hucho hucho TaxID=62062 RepID=A0A4W5PTP3_9TELE
MLLSALFVPIGDFSSSRCSPRPLRASLVSSSSASSFRQALSGTRTVLPVSRSPGLPLPEWGQSQNGQRFNPPAPSSLQDHLSERNLHLDLDHLSLQDQDQEQEEDNLDRQEMLNSLRSLRCSAAKKKAKVSLSGSDPDPDSPDSAMKLELALDSPSQTSPTITSPASESGLSSIYSPPNSTLNGTKTSPGNSASSSAKRVPSAKLRSSVSMDVSALQGFTLRDKIIPEVSVIGQRVSYLNGPMEPEEEDRTREYSPPPTRPACREPVKALRPAKGSQIYSNRNSPVADMPEGVVGRGVFGLVILSSRPGIAMSMEQGDCMTRLHSDPPTGIYSHAVPSHLLDPDDSPDAEETREKVRTSRFARNKMRQQGLAQQEGQPALGDRQKADRMRLHLRQGQNDVATEDTAAISKGPMFFP